MFVSNSDTAAPISTSPARALENVRARMGRILEHSGSGPNKETRAVLDRLETEQEAWQQAADEETIGRWEHQQRLLKVHRALSEAKKGLMAFKLIAVETFPALENKPTRYGYSTSGGPTSSATHPVQVVNGRQNPFRIQNSEKRRKEGYEWLFDR
jgi:hypothetical protein